MEKFFVENLSNPYWWISVVFVGVMLNILSRRLDDALTNRLSKVSSRWRQRGEAKRKEIARRASALKGNRELLAAARQHELRLKHYALMHAVFGIGFFIIGFLYTQSINQMGIGEKISAALSFLGAYFVLGRFSHFSSRSGEIEAAIEQASENSRALTDIIQW